MKLEARTSSGALRRQLARLGAELEAVAVQAAVRAILKNVVPAEAPTGPREARPDDKLRPESRDRHQ